MRKMPNLFSGTTPAEFLLMTRSTWDSARNVFHGYKILWSGIRKQTSIGISSWWSLMAFGEQSLRTGWKGLMLSCSLQPNYISRSWSHECWILSRMYAIICREVWLTPISWLIERCPTPEMKHECLTYVFGSDFLAIVGRLVLRLVLPAGPDVSDEEHFGKYIFSQTVINSSNSYSGAYPYHSGFIESVETVFSRICMQIIKAPSPFTTPLGWYRNWIKVLQHLTLLKDNIALGSEHEGLATYVSDVLVGWGKVGKELGYNWRPVVRCDNPRCIAVEVPPLACESCCSAFYCSRSCQEQYVSTLHKS